MRVESFDGDADHCNAVLDASWAKEFYAWKLAQAVEEEKEEDSVAPDMDAIEVEKKGKEEGEEEAA